MAYDFPGNIRELENLLERAIILSEGDSILPADFPGISPPDSKNYSSGFSETYEIGSDSASVAGLFDGSLKDIERRALGYVLERNQGNRSRSAEQLGISRKTLINKIKEYGLDSEAGSH
jgi:two-component system response regulator AtoC